MARRRLWVGVRIGPFILGGRVGGRRRRAGGGNYRRRQYRPGVHPMMQDNLRFAFREIARRRAERRG